MFCMHCGAQVADGSAFCTKCGSPLVPAYGQQNAGQQPQQGVESYPPAYQAEVAVQKKGMSGGAIAGIIIGILVVLALIAVIAMRAAGIGPFAASHL